MHAYTILLREQSRAESFVRVFSDIATRGISSLSTKVLKNKSYAYAFLPNSI
jgi:hypothetical protein